jgi:mono/diheme cytochrome c family protein
LADFKDERAYDSKNLTKWFLWSSLALLACVAWMAYDDYHKPWKDYQRKFMKLERKMAVLKGREAKEAIDWAAVKQLKADLRSAKKDLRSERKAIRKLEKKQVSLKGQIYKVNSEYQLVKAHIDKEKFEYSEHYLKHGKDSKSRKKKLDNLLAKADKLGQRVFEMRKEKDEAASKLVAIYTKVDEVQGKSAQLTKEYDFQRAKAKGLEFNWLFQFRNAMLLDFMAPTLTIRQIVMPHLPDDMYFAKTQRVDRCTTCHLGIDRKGFEDAPQPFKTHPRLDLYVGSASPHSLEKTGCTVCHGGVGQALDFTMTAHVPNDEKSAKRWHKKLGWHAPHGIEGPMVALKYTEGSCLKCHNLQQHVNFAPKLNRGRELMVTRGCVGCHKVKNLENLPKAGPSLLKVKGKLKKDFVEKWVWEPTSFNPKARMPAFFNQSNNQDEDGLAKNKAELKALVGVLYDGLSADYDPPEAYPGGSASRGKKLFKDVGCLACHGIEDVTAFHADFAPDLSGTGSKLTASFVYSWVRNPRHYDPTTRMPSLRLSAQEASDITAYLMSKKNTTFEQATAPESDPAVRDELVISYLKPQVGERTAKEQLAAMDEKARNDYLGKKTLNKYGCFGCHTIAGYENAPGIGTELSEWASKRINQLDFGFMEFDHSHEGFLLAKLENPRIFDKGRVVSFQDRLKMPHFHLSEEDRESIAVAVLGLSKTYIPDGMTAGIHGNGALLEKGRRVVEKFNCRGCHVIDGKAGIGGQGGRIRELFKAEGREYYAPPILNTIGARTQLEFLHSFLKNPKEIRRNLDIRMPSVHWTDEDMSALLTYMNLKEDQVFPYHSVKANNISGQELAEAKQLFDKLQCQKCHMVQGRPPQDRTSTAPDLAQVRKRLKPEWVVEWLKNPDAIMPGTAMTSFWPDGGPADPKLLGGDSLRQRKAIRDYLFQLGSGGE